MAKAKKEIATPRLKLELQRGVNDAASGIERSTPDRSFREESSVRLNLIKLFMAFDERKAYLDEYIRRFEGIACSPNWPKEQWATALSTCRSGEALSVYDRQSPNDTSDYPKIRAARLK